MINNPTYISVPLFGGAAPKVAPTSPTYDDGFDPGVILPTENLSYFLNGFSGNDLTQESAILALIQELQAILIAAGVTVDPTNHQQVITSLNALFPQLSGSSGALNMGGNKISNMAGPTLGGDATTRDYVQNYVTNYIANSVIVTGDSTRGALTNNTRFFCRLTGAAILNVTAGAFLGCYLYVENQSVAPQTLTLRVQTGGTGTGYDIILLQNEWVFLIWDGAYWMIVVDGFTTEKVFRYTAGAGTHIVPAGRRIGRATVQGPGGNGGSGGVGAAHLPNQSGGGGGAGGGGGGGGCAIGFFESIPGAALAYVVGAVGSGSSFANPAGTLIGGPGGNGNNGSNAGVGAITQGSPGGAGGAGGAGGSASGGNIANKDGQAGNPGGPGGNGNTTPSTAGTTSGQSGSSGGFGGSSVSGPGGASGAGGQGGNLNADAGHAGSSGGNAPVLSGGGGGGGGGGGAGQAIGGGIISDGGDGGVAGGGATGFVLIEYQ